MEVAVALSLLGTGYYFSNKSNNNRVANNNNKNLKKYNLGVNNVYDSNYDKRIKNKEQQLLNESFARSNYVKKTNIVNPATIRDHLTQNDLLHSKPDDELTMNLLNKKAIEEDKIVYVNKPSDKNMVEEFFVSPLTGQKMSKKSAHNNVVPFFGGSVKQNTNAEATASHMEHFTGDQKMFQKKQETAPLFAPKSNVNHVYGTPNMSSSTRDRFIQSRFHEGVPVIEKQYVGPGLNQGFSKKPSGGFHQQDAQIYAMPKNVDELRTANNPKVSYTTPVIEGMSTVVNRGKLGKVNKDRPNTFYVNSPARYNVTTGAYVREKGRPVEIIKKTRSAGISRSYEGSAMSSGAKRKSNRPLFRESNKQSYETPSTRNMKQTGSNTKDDYGKKSMPVKPTEREVTEKRTHITNIATQVKALITPIQDIMKTSKKENFIGNERQTGNFGASVPKKQTVYDPNDVAKTTIKETNIHDVRTGNMNGPIKLTTYDPNDIAKQTIKETNIHDVRTGAIGYNAYKTQAYDDDDLARTTLKETNIHDVRTGTMGYGAYKTQAYDDDDVARTTLKETNINDVRTGTMTSGVNKTPAYDPNDITKTTIKETNIHDVRTGTMASGVNKTPAYDPNDITKTTIKETNIHDVRTGTMGTGEKHGVVKDPDDIAKTTVRETTDNEDTVLNMRANGTEKMTAYDPDDHTRTTIKETNIELIRTGNMDARGKEGAGYLTNDIQVPNTNKQFTSDNEHIGQPNGDHNKGGGTGYLTNDIQVPNTHKQFISDHEHVGNAHAREGNAPSNRDSEYRATYGGDREVVAQGRKPTKVNASIPSGMEKINLDINKIEGDRINNRDMASTKVYNAIEQLSNCNVTTDKQMYKQNIQIERNEPNILKAFKQNIYTQPLDSFEFP
jgi:hypothetical protein